MYNGKFNRKRRLAWSKELVILCSIVVMVLGMAGGTLAYLTHQTQDEVNTFITPAIDVTIPETFDEKVKTDVHVENECEFEVFARATYVEYWQNEEGEIYPEVPELDISLGNEWKKNENDGYWYCTKVLNPKGEDGSKSPVFIQKANAKKDAPDGYHLVIDVIGEVIQSEPVQAVQDVWGEDAAKLVGAIK